MVWQMWHITSFALSSLSLLEKVGIILYSQACLWFILTNVTSKFWDGFLTGLCYFISVHITYHFRTLPFIAIRQNFCELCSIFLLPSCPSHMSVICKYFNFAFVLIRSWIEQILITEQIIPVFYICITLKHPQSTFIWLLNSNDFMFPN